MKTDAVPDAQMVPPDEITSVSNAAIVETPASYEKCLTCPDLGVNCKGPRMNKNAREYHRRLKKCRNISLRQIYVLTVSEISEGAVRDYFGHGEQDFRFTTVAAIDNALLYLCGGCSLPDVSDCPASCSEFRELLDSEIARRIQAEDQCFLLQSQMAEAAEKHLSQLDDFRKSQQDRDSWLRSDIRLWRIIAFCLLGAFCISLLF